MQSEVVDARFAPRIYGICIKNSFYLTNSCDLVPFIQEKLLGDLRSRFNIHIYMKTDT